MCVVSAVIGMFVILATVIAELVLYYMRSDWLTIWPSSSTAPNLTDLVTSTVTTSANETLINQIDSISSAIFNETFNVAFNDTTTILPDTIANATDTLYNVAAGTFNTTTTTGISLHDTIFLTFISIIGILAAVTVGLLLHLCFFHVYISFLGLTTYEYIRNQRQLEAKMEAKKLQSQTATAAATTLDTLKKSSTSSNQIYFCSHIDPKNLIENHNAQTKQRSKTFYCCDSSMQYENTTHKAFYFCSVLHDRPSPILVPSSMAHELTLNSSRTSRSKTFHCCSKYKQIVKVSECGDEVSAQTDESITTSSVASEYVKFVEQCTFCSFKLGTKRKSKVAAIDSNATQLNNHHNHQPSPSPQQQLQNHTDDVDFKLPARKHKWNCCSKVDDSPDSETSATPQIDTISASIDPKANRNHIHQRLKGSYDEHKLYAKNGANSLDPVTKLTVNGSIAKPISRKNRAALATNLKNSGNNKNGGNATRSSRLRRMLQMFGRCQQPHYPSTNSQHVNNDNHSRHRPPSPRCHIKQNQVRPMDMLEQQCEELQQQRRHQQTQQLHNELNMPNHFHSKRTSSECTDNDSNGSHAATAKMPPSTKSMTQPPAPPPPIRRKINATGDMQELAESLSFVQNPSHHHHHYPSRLTKQKEHIQKTQPPRPLLMVSRKRRKNIFRSPNLSPIHETGYSNPTSPKPCRHSSTQDSESSASTPKIAHQY